VKRISQPADCGAKEVAFPPWTPLVTGLGAFSYWWFAGRI